MTDMSTLLLKQRKADLDYELIGSTVILMEPFVVRDGRPKSGVGRRGFLNKQLLLS